MSYYNLPWGNDATFILQDAKGKIRTKVNGKTRGLAGCGKTRVRLEMLSSVGDLCD
jgi:hypothetical protein